MFESDPVSMLITPAVRGDRARQLLSLLTAGARVLHRRRQWYIERDGERVDVIPRHLVRAWVSRGFLSGSVRDGWLVTDRGRAALDGIRR